MTPNALTRRAMLRGLGVSMALPWMESAAACGAGTSPASKASQDAPTRMAILFAGCGFHRHEWWAKGSGSKMELGKVLHPLKDFRDRMVFIKGLYNAEALKGNIHSSQTGNLLSGALHFPQAGRFGPGPASIRSLPSESVSRRSCRVLCSVAKRRTRRCIRITRCSTARTFPGAAQRHRLLWKCIRPWRLISCSRTKLKRVTKACSMRFWPMRGTFVAASAGSISKNWMSI